MPLDAAQNEGRFLGAILLGGRPLTRLQRVGTVIIATPFLASGLAALALVIWRPEVLVVRTAVGELPNFPFLIFLLVVLFLSLRLVTNAIRAPRNTSRHS